jgi:glycosyltransferase involved in cell wall biosynthesis
MNNPPKKLSICIPTYNRASCLEDCLNSILAASDKCRDRIEIVISDNAGTDNTKQVVEQFRERYEFIRYSRNNKNVFDENFFITASLATGDYIWIFADDDKMEKEALNEVFSAIDNDHNLIICNYSIWDRDFKSVIKARRYNYKTDMRFCDSNRLLQTFGIGLQFISSIVIKKDVFFRLPEAEYAPLHEYGCSFLFSVYSGIRTDLDAIFISKPLLRYRGSNSPLSVMNRWYKVFATGSTLLLNQLERKGYSSQAVHIAKRMVLRDYIMRDISFRRRDKQNVQGIFRLIVPYYKDCLFFWLVVAPMLISPRFLITFANKCLLLHRKLRTT